MSGSGRGPTDDLYQRVVLDHARAPRNLGALSDATHHARGDNPFCGDRVTVSLIVRDDRIADVRFDGGACAVATASASMMTVAIKGLSRDETTSMGQRFEALLASAADQESDAGDAALGELRAFAGVRRFPVRVKCARLPWQTLMAALAGGGATVSTE